LNPRPFPGRVLSIPVLQVKSLSQARYGHLLLYLAEQPDQERLETWLTGPRDPPTRAASGEEF